MMERTSLDRILRHEFTGKGARGRWPELTQGRDGAPTVRERLTIESVQTDAAGQDTCVSHYRVGSWRTSSNSLSRLICATT
jgi:hypothetical protein